MTKFTTCHKCKEEFFYADDHECKPGVEEERFTWTHQVDLEYKCQSGCQVFMCGSIKHNEHCKNYPESRAFMMDQRDEEIQRLKGALGKYGRHRDGCLWLIYPTADCSCGFRETLFKNDRLI